MKPALLAVLASVSVLLAGCTWFQASTNNAAQPAVVTNSNATTNTSLPQNTTELKRQDLGFSLRYPSSVKVVVGTACVEGCPSGLAAPDFAFQTAGSDVAHLTVYKNEQQMLQQLGSNATSIAAYTKSGVTDLHVTKMEAGTLYAYVRPGLPASNAPSIYGNSGTPDMIMSVLVATNGRVYAFNAANGEATPLVSTMLDTFKLE